MVSSKKKDVVPKPGRKKVVLAYSGGLDTSVAIRWLQDNYDLDVVAVSIDVGQPGDMEKNIDRAKNIGAVAAYALDAREEFVEGYVWPSLKANALYQGIYPLSTAIARPLIAKLLVDVARKEGAEFIAHGCTAKGNDQVRFDVSIAALAPDIGIIAPMREWVMTREEEIDYAKKNSIPIPVKKACPYSTDENLWGRSCECGVIEDASKEPPEDSHEWTVSPLKAPDKPTYVEIGFEKGTPVSLDGKKLGPVELMKSLNKLAGENGVGRVDIVENRLVGIKSRGVYETPAGTVLHAAHRDLEAICLDRETQHLKDRLAHEYAELVYYGLWFTKKREALDAFIEETQKNVTGTVRVKLYKGSCMAVGRKSPVTLYEPDIATFDASALYDQKDATGFLRIFGLPLRVEALLGKKRK